MISKYLSKIGIIVFMLSILFPSTCFSGSPVSGSLITDIQKQTGVQGLNKSEVFEPMELMSIVSTIIKIFLSLLGAIFTVLMLLGGYTWMTAQGDESKVEKAKSTIQTAVIGLIIVVSTYSITYTIFKAL